MSDEGPSYREAVGIGWRILWPVAGSFVVLLVVANFVLLTFLPELTRSGPSLAALALPLAAAAVVAALVVMPRVVQTVVGKPFSGFRLKFVRDDGRVSGLHSPEPSIRRSGHETPHANRDDRPGAARDPSGEPRAAA
jgi:hypothetical protein